MAAPASYRFGPYRLDRAAYRLLHGDRAIELSPKAIDLLLLLVDHAGSLVTKDDILKAVWPDVAVTDNALTQVVSDLRHALGDQSSAPRYVETVPRRGYRFIAPVETAQPGTPAHADTPEAGSKPKTIAVLDFANVTGEPDLGWLARGIAETVTNDLRVIRDLRVIDRALVSHVRADAATDHLKAAGLDLVVIGSFQRAGDHVRITARLTDVSTREGRWTARGCLRAAGRHRDAALVGPAGPYQSGRACAHERTRDLEPRGLPGADRRAAQARGAGPG
jgi:DNA-binding winged helix-turn-helix (wHTH) protein